MLLPLLFSLGGIFDEQFSNKGYFMCWLTFIALLILAIVSPAHEAQKRISRETLVQEKSKQFYLISNFS
jgi:hypothetical protein